MSDAQTRLRVHLRLIDEGVAPVVARYRGQIKCRAGCSECCHQSFRVSELEGALLREGFDKLAPAVQADISTRARDFKSGDACPVLSAEGECRLYEHRPRICRKYGIPLWHPDRPHELTTCRLNFREEVDLEADLIVEPQAGWAEDWISLREELGLAAQDNRSIAAWLAEL